MRLILSRKGFDSAAGCIPSPIFPDGTLISLPIPEERGTTRYSEIESPVGSLGTLVRDLSDGRILPSCPAHLDPDLVRSARPRRKGWRPAFGQNSAAATHLDRLGVGSGDVFLFFGWFKRVDRADGRWTYVPGAPDLHVIFGWLRVGEVRQETIRGNEDHPHFTLRTRYTSNSRVYLAGSPADGGVFPAFHRELQLTRDGLTRSNWRLPADFIPLHRPPLSYHANQDRWSSEGDQCLLRTVGRGQEFVLDLDLYTGVERWVENLIRRHRPSEDPSD
jgi:hypothetical protein